ncbi:hypothetical protein D3C71_1867320 [compost metagenome]
MCRLELFGIIQRHVGEAQAECRLAATHLAVDGERVVQVFEKGFAHALSPSSGGRAGNQNSCSTKRDL